MAYMGTGRHLVTGDPEPPRPAEDVLRVYGMKFCPFVQRLKLVMHAKDIDHENINCNLKRKPEWLFEKNPRGKVPVLELNGRTIYESDITSRYIDEVYPGNRKLSTADPWRRAEEHMLLGDLDKSISGFYGVALAATDDEKRKEAFDKINSGYASLEKHLEKYGQPFIGGKKPGISDYMFWPFLERMHMLMMYQIQQHAVIMKYYHDMLEDPAVIACRHPDDVHQQFIATYRSGDPVHDIGDVDDTSPVTMCRSSKL